LLGLDKGPKLGLLLLALPKKELIRMLDFKRTIDNFILHPFILLIAIFSFFLF